MTRAFTSKVTLTGVALALAVGSWAMMRQIPEEIQPRPAEGRLPAAVKHSPERSSFTPTMDEKVQALKAELEALRTQLRSLVENPNRSRQASQASDVWQQDGESGTDVPSFLVDPQDQPIGVEIAEQMTQRMKHEMRDAVWAGKAEAEIASVFSGDGLKGSTVLAIECRSTLCRADSIHDSEEAVNIYLDQLPQAVGFADTGFFTISSEPKGGQKVTIFLLQKE